MSLKVQDLKKVYFQGELEIPVLRGLSVNVEKAEVVAVLGQSGSGKSTLLALLAGLDKADSGSIRVGDTEIEKLSSAQTTEWRGKNVGIVFQQFHLVSHLTAQENIELPLEILGWERAEREKRAFGLLEAIGLSGRSHHRPSQLSGGECQRIAIARALAPRPQLILADEPSGNLDIETGEKVMAAFFEQIRAAKTTCILVTHNRDLADRCDRRFALRQGRLEALS
jgi:putative ABC transport system ATP-binding protein